MPLRLPSLFLAVAMAAVVGDRAAMAQTAIPPFLPGTAEAGLTEGSTDVDSQRQGALPPVFAPTAPPNMTAGFMTTEQSRDVLFRDPAAGRQLDYLRWLPEGPVRLPGAALGYAFVREMPRPGDALVETASWAAVNPFDFWMLTSGDDRRRRQQVFAGKHRARYQDFKYRALEEGFEVGHGH